jgi:hypothetical protein
MAKKCASCSTENADAAKFCAECSVKFPEEKKKDEAPEATPAKPAAPAAVAEQRRGSDDKPGTSWFGVD